jgi:hypothetical protein
VVDLGKGTDSMDFHYDDKQSTVREVSAWIKKRIKWITRIKIIWSNEIYLSFQT